MISKKKQMVAVKRNADAKLERFEQLESPVNDLVSMAQLLYSAFMDDPKASSTSFAVFHLEEMINEFHKTYYDCFAD